MSNTGPRRPKGESGVQRANARPAQDDPTRGSLLTSFLGNAQAASTTTDPDDVLAVALRTVLKRHETTKLKALSDIESCFQSENLTDEKAAFYAGSFAHAFRQCATSESGVVRRKICRCLSLLFARSKEVKLALARELPTVFGPWLMLSCDTWPDVAEEGARAFTLAFPDVKLKEATARFAVQSLAFLTNEVETCLATPLPSDSTDPRVNTVASCFAALAKLVSTLRADDALVEPVLAFIRDGECMQKLIAPKGAKGGSIQKSTVARAGLIAMFASIINTYPDLKPDDSLHAAVARTAQSSMFDSDATVSHDAWSLFLVWGSAFPSLATEPVIAVVRALPGVIKDVAATPGLPSTLTTTLMPLFALCKKVPGVPTQALDAIMDTLADAAATSTDATVKASLVAAWIECWSTTVMSNDSLLSVTSALSLFFDHCHYKRNDSSRVDVLCNALAGTLIRFVSRAGTTFESSSAVTEYSRSIASFVASDLRALVGVASTAATFCSLVASADRLSAQSAAIAVHLHALNDTVGEHLLASVADVTSMTHLLTSVSKIAAARGALSRAVVTLLNGPDTVSTIAGCLVRHDALATEVVGPVEAALSPQARTALAAAFTNAGKDDVMPAFLRAAVSDLAGKAADRRDWAAVTALLKASDVSAVKQVSTALISAISKVKSIDEVDPMLRLAEQLVVAKGDDATGELSLQADAACKLLRGFSGLLIDVMPAWTVEAFAAADLEDAEPDSEDDSNASRSGGDDNGSDSRSSSSRASSSSSNVGDHQESEGDADISASAATQLTVAAISRFAALCGLVAGGSHVLLEFADAVTHTVVDSEGSSTVRNGRPSPAAILAVFAKVPEAARGVLEGMLFDELVSDCLSDLEEVDPAVASRCLQRGAYQRQVLRTTLFKQPVAAVGLMAAVALDLVVVVGSSSVPHSLTGVDLWIAGLAKCRLISPVLTLKSNRAVDQLLLRALQSPNAATDVATAAAADDIFGPLITSALAGFITTHPGLPNSLKLALITRLVVTVVDRFLQEPNVHVEVLRVVLRFLEGAQLGLMTKRLSEEVTAALTNLADRSTSITVVTAALQALRLMAARPIPLSPALLKRVVALRDAAPRASADGIAVVAEAMLWSCTDAGLAMEAATVAERSIVVAFSLHHLPTNGKLGQRTPLMAPVPVESLRAFTVALHVMRRGLARLQTIHASSTADGALASLRTTMNLVDLDIACECVLRLKTISHDKSAELVDALSDVSKCIASIQRADLKTLRASPKSVAVIAQLLASLHFWICARPMKLFQQEGDDDALQQVIALTSRLASIALVESDAASALLCLVPVINRGPVKPLPGRTSDATTAVELKPRLVKRHLTQSVSTNKNCLSLQSYFAAWYACLTNESGLCQEAANRAAEAAAGRAKLEPQVGVDNRIAVYQLLDIILALAHSRPQDSTGSGHRTYITDALSGRETNRTLGFDFTLFGEAPAAAADGGGRPAAVHQLALQGFCLLSLLLQRRTVRFVRTWIEGLNRSLRAGFEALVEVYLGPALTQLALSEVIAHSPTGSSKFEPAEFNGAVSITVVDTSRTVLARFTADDVSFDVKFTVPAAYPLRPASIDQDSIKPKTRAGVPAERWRAWMLKVTMMLVNGGSTVWGCIALIAENLEKQLEGVEPCPICYSVISQTTQKLPEMSCLVCKNSKFHSACLYEWWGNSGQTSCPMCRSPWFSSS